MPYSGDMNGAPHDGAMINGMDRVYGLVPTRSATQTSSWLRLKASKRSASAYYETMRLLFM